MQMSRHFVKGVYYHVKTGQFREAVRTLVDALEPTNIFIADNLITWSRNLSFLDDEKLIAAFDRSAENVQEQGLLWRIAVLGWAARRGLQKEGDFVECGVYRGTTARILCDYLDFGQLPRRYYLYDLFEHSPEMPHHGLPEHGPELHRQVVQRFADVSNVVIVKGALPESLSLAAPQRIAMLHIDLNNAAAETAVLEALYDRVADGAAIVLDDYGWLAYRAQKDAADAFFRRRGNLVLELPTGQGLVIK